MKKKEMSSCEKYTYRR